VCYRSTPIYFLRIQNAKRYYSMAITIRSVDFINGNVVIVELSDGKTVQVTVEQILRLNPQVLPENEPDLA
jgi:hypothetical protein